MDTLGVESYLRSACSVLNFDIGELWIARRLPGQSPTMTFIQLYTSPTYSDFHNLLLRPTVPGNQREDKHRFSPIICRCVCDGGSIVWANTRTLEGLVGTTELPLNSAVGMPICSVGYDVFIMVLFAVEKIPITPNSIEFLLSIAHAASAGDGGGFTAPSKSTPVTAAKTEAFVGLWDMAELLETYARDVSFSLLPIRKLESFLDLKESRSIIEFFSEFKRVRDAGFQPKQLQSLQRGGNARTLLIGNRERSWSLSSTNSSSWFIGSRSEDDSFGSDTTSITSTTSSTSTRSPSENPPPVAFCQPVLDEEEDAGRLVQGLPRLTAFSVDSRASYRADPSRFQEFMVGLLGITVFDAVELWLVSDKVDLQPELYVVASLNREKSLERWTTESIQGLRLKAGVDLPGQVFQSAQPFWDGKYNAPSSSSGIHSRSALAVELGVTTAFGVPLPGGTQGVSGVLALYSKVKIEPEPLMVSLVQKSAQILSAGAMDRSLQSQIDIESLVFNPNALIDDMVVREFDSPVGRRYQVLDETIVKVNVMGSVLSRSKTQISSLAEIESETDGEGIPLICLAAANPVPKVDQFKGVSRKRSNRNEVYEVYEDDSGFLSLLALGSQQRDASVSMPNIATKAKRRAVGGSEAEDVSSGLRMCKIDACGSLASARSPYCLNHVGPRRCQAHECTKCAQGATRFCIFHGGGRRCTFSGCQKGARDKLFCARHGGGKRCERPDCSKSSVGGSGLCTAHGGGKRCQHSGCEKSSQSNTNFCVRHGGGRKCIADGCTKVSRGKTSFCASHGGGASNTSLSSLG